MRGMNPLAEYLTTNQISQRAFAKRLGVDQATVSRLVRRAADPSIRLARSIEQETGGAIPAAYWVEPRSESAA